MKIIDLRDDITDIIDLVDVCRLAILSREQNDAYKVANVLYCTVIEKLKLLDENLKEIRQEQG